MPLTVLNPLNLPGIGTWMAAGLTVSHYGTESRASP